jgi:hypothetical protein
MDGWYDRDRLFVGIDAGENACCLDDARQALIEHFRRQVLEMQVDMVLFLADTPPLANFDRLGSAHHVPRGQVLLAGRILGHEALALAVGQEAALATGALSDQAALPVDTTQ